MSKCMTLLTGHRVKTTLAVTGYFMVEASPGEDVWLFSHDPAAEKIRREHNRLFQIKYGDAAVAAEEKKYADWCTALRRKHAARET